MINLLPKDHRDSIMYARRNTKLLNICFALVIVILIVVGMWGLGYFYMNKTAREYNRTIAQKQADLKAQNLEETEARIETFSNNLKLILQVLEKEVLFSKLFRQVGAVMPSGAILSNIELSEISGGIDLTVNAKDYDTATQAQVNLEAKDNKLFQKVDIVSVSCSNGDDEAASETSNQNSAPENTPTTPETGNTLANEYPCTANLRALFNEENPFLFINKSGRSN